VPEPVVVVVATAESSIPGVVDSPARDADEAREGDAAVADAAAGPGVALSKGAKGGSSEGEEAAEVREGEEAEGAGLAFAAAAAAAAVGVGASPEARLAAAAPYCGVGTTICSPGNGTIAPVRGSTNGMGNGPVCTNTLMLLSKSSATDAAETMRMSATLRTNTVLCEKIDEKKHRCSQEMYIRPCRRIARRIAQE